LALTTRSETGKVGDEGSTTALGRLAGGCYDHRRLVLVSWILALIALTVIAQVFGTHFQNKFSSGNTQSQQAANILAARFPAKAGDTADVVFHSTGALTSERNRAAVNAVVASIEPWRTCARHQPVRRERGPPDLT